MFLFYVLSFFKKWDTIQGGTLFKGGHYLRKYGKYMNQILPDFDLFESTKVDILHKYYVSTICHVTHHDLSIVAINWQYVCLPTLILT